MQNILKGLGNFKIKAKTYSIDNLSFKFHYVFTTRLLFIFTLMITSQELIGAHIKCLTDKGGVPEDIINRFCFFTSTFTVVKYLEKGLVNSSEIAHPGVGSMGVDSHEPIKRHAYYQWVPFVLFMQALMFYVPHIIWKQKEGNRMKKLSMGLEFAAFATERSIKIGKVSTPTKTDVSQKFQDLKIAYRDHLVVNKSWAFWFVTCECLNLLNVLLQIYITNEFLGGQFYGLGISLIKDGLSADIDILEVIFPKMTKCTFYKFGPSGTIQSMDSMCVMALNIINEKVYSFLWFWYLALTVVSLLALFWRLLTYLLHAKYEWFNNMVFKFNCPGHIDTHIINSLTSQCSFRDWLFLVYLSKNLDNMVFCTFCAELHNELCPIDIHTARRLISFDNQYE